MEKEQKDFLEMAKELYYNNPSILNQEFISVGRTDVSNSYFAWLVLLNGWTNKDEVKHKYEAKVLADHYEQVSRKEKLVVGSEWVCVADCYHFNGLITNGEIFTLKRVNKMRVTISSLDCETYVMYEQFLLCFKPKEVNL